MDELDTVIIIGVGLAVLYLLYKAGNVLNEVGSTIQSVESIL